ncbi:MAG: hypothetical protein M3R17_00910 [Bacteroidota bacterium]|nr:hypothetical protein [Bacteroidota bacterium]
MIPKRIFLFLFLLSGVLQLHAQSDTILVKTVATKITVLPERSFLYLNEDNIFKIKYTGKNKMGRMELKGGTIEQKDSTYNFKTTTGTSAILVIYEKLKNGTEKIAYTYTYKLFGREVPRVTLDGVPNDSVVDKFTVIALGRLQCRQKYGTDKYQVVSFKIYIKNGKKFDTLSAKGNQLTLQMKRKIDSMDVKKNGGILMFENIKAIGPGGKEIDLPPLRIYLRDVKVTSFGTGGWKGWRFVGRKEW